MASDVDKGENKTKKTGGIALIISCVLVLCLFYSVLFRPQKEISIEENRTLQKVPAFSVKAFLKGTFQDEMERSIGDQLLFSIQIKYGVKQAFNFLTKQTAKLDGKSRIQTSTIAPIDEVTRSNASPQNNSASDTTKTSTTSTLIPAPVQPDKNSYTYKEVVAGKLYKLDDSGYIVEKPHAPEEYEFELYDPKMLEAVTFPKYLYFIECSESADFNDLYKYNAFDYIKKHMPPMTGYDKLNYNSFDEYKRLFYQTDHHWNYHGSYIGYTQIIRMLEGPNVEIQKPVRTHVYDTIYNGSLARDNLLKCSTEKFTVYEYDLPPYKTYVNDEEKEYGYRSL